MVDAGIGRYRADFPILSQKVSGKPVAYLDSAASAQKPRAVIDAMRHVMETHYANIHRGLYAFSHTTTTAFEKSRRTVSDFIGAAREEEIIFTRNATEGINLVAQSWGHAYLKAGDEVILSGMEHHANIVPWQLLRDQIGIVIKIIPVKDNGTLDLEAYKSLLSPKTRAISVVHVSNALGTVNPVFEINRVAKDYNSSIRVLIDGSQAVVHMPVSVSDLGCDFYVFTGHKLYGPTGIGILWGRYDLLAAMPPYQGGGDMIERVTFEKTTYKAPPSRFEAGTPAIIEAIGLNSAIDYVSQIGLKKIAEHESGLLAAAMEQLKDIGGLTFHGAAPKKAGIISFTADWGHPGDIGTILDQCGVAVRVGHHCCQPLMKRFGVEATVRASFGLYSNLDDIESLVAGLKTAKGLLS